jgi:ribosomal protein L37AE/L43A
LAAGFADHVGDSPDQLERTARLIAAARGEDINAVVCAALREYVGAGATVSTHERFSGRLWRCRQCGIRVPRGEMVYGQRACSEDYANTLWFKETFDAFVD